MDRQNRKYHRDFDFKHYYKFVPPLSQVFIEWVGKAILLGILYAVALYLFHFHDVARYLKWLFYIYTGYKILAYLRYKVAWHHGMVRTSAVAQLKPGQYLRGEIAERRVNLTSSHE